jgi:aspartate aminotransferase
MQRLVSKLQRVSVDIDAYQEKRDILCHYLSEMGFRLERPAGAFYLFPRSPFEDDVEFVKLAQQYHILLVPGSGFGAPGYFRIAYCVDKEMIVKSLPAWRELAKESGIIK